MKNLVVAALLAAGFLATEQAQALRCEFQNCGTTIAANSGVNAKQCSGTTDACSPSTTKTDYCTGMYYTTYSCPFTKPYHYATKMDGTWFCTESTSCQLPTPEDREQLRADADYQLDEAFGDRTDYHYGYINGASRSPTNGRTVSAPARLDACLGNGEVDALGTGSSGWMNCYSKCDSTANGYCNNSGLNNGSTVTNAPCKDRCDCVITGFGTCENI